MDDDRPLNTEEMKELARRLTLMSQEGVKRLYREAYERCRFDRELPKACDIQHLVTAWKQLWKWRG